MLVKLACRLRDEGKSRDEVYAILESEKNKIQHFILVDDLMYLKRGGRITPAVALLGGMLKIVPVMELNYEIGGRIDTLAKVRTLSKARVTAIDRMVELGVNKDDYIFTIEHVLCEDSALELQNVLFEKIGKVDVDLRELPSVVGAHMGVGGLGIQYIKKYKGD
jgi:DegV family protein with EDD domain